MSEKEFYPPKYLEQQYKKWQQLRQWKDQSIQSYTNKFYRLMDKIGVQEEENFQKDKMDHSRQAPTEKWCDYNSSAWHDMLECKARKTFLEKLSTFDLSTWSQSMVFLYA